LLFDLPFPMADPRRLVDLESFLPNSVRMAMSALGQKRTSEHVQSMSALSQKRTWFSTIIELKSLFVRGRHQQARLTQRFDSLRRSHATHDLFRADDRGDLEFALIVEGQKQ